MILKNDNNSIKILTGVFLLVSIANIGLSIYLKSNDAKKRNQANGCKGCGKG